MIRTLFALTLALPAVVAQSPLETTFNFATAGFVVTNTAPNTITALFDVTINSDILLTNIDLQSAVSLGTNGQLDVYLTAAGGTHVGNEQNAAAWTLAGTASQVHNGGRVVFTLATPIVLTAGTYGVAYHCIEANPIYHGGAVSATLPQTYSSTELTIDLTAGRNRISDIADAFGGTTLGFSPRQVATSWTYSVGGLTADFTSDVTGGASPLAVQFTAIAATTDPGGIVAYAWDFDNDGTADSFVQNPSFTYTTCGTFSVSLEVFDGLGSVVATKTDYIVTDTMTPNFTSEVIAPNTVQFTDTTTPTPTGWAWDFDNDGNIDSTVQNPLFAFATGACTEAIVNLDTTLACQTASITKNTAVASTLETTFQGGLITSATDLSAANYFDIDVTNPLGISACGMHVNSGVAAGQPLTVNIYQTTGTYVGATDDASLWRLVATETVTAGAADTFVPFATPVHFAFGSHGICMEHIGASPVYTNLGGPLTVTTSDLTLTAGLSQAPPLFDATSTTFSPRIANIRLHYSTSQATSAPGYGYVGLGCPGSLGVPGNVSSTQPVVGGAATVELSNLPLDIALLAIGLSALPAPLDLTFIGIDNCSLYHSAEVVNTVVGAGNAAQAVINIPNNPTFIGIQFYTQGASLDIGLNPLGFAMSDAAVMLIGQ